MIPDEVTLNGQRRARLGHFHMILAQELAVPDRK